MPIPKNITWVTFDVYGTLIDWEGGIYDAFSAEAARDDVEIDEELWRFEERDLLLARLLECKTFQDAAQVLHARMLEARESVARYGGRLPDREDELRQMPGIGRYTAGAIASMAFGRRAPIVEANTVRVYSRLLAFTGDPQSTAGRKQIWDFAERCVPARSAGQFNQALMELGALVCTPTAPNCGACPLARRCVAFQQGVQDTIPLRVKAAPPTPVRGRHRT